MEQDLNIENQLYSSESNIVGLNKNALSENKIEQQSKMNLYINEDKQERIHEFQSSANTSKISASNKKDKNIQKKIQNEEWQQKPTQHLKNESSKNHNKIILNTKKYTRRAIYNFQKNSKGNSSYKNRTVSLSKQIDKTKNKIKFNDTMPTNTTLRCFEENENKIKNKNTYSFQMSLKKNKNDLSIEDKQILNRVEQLKRKWIKPQVILTTETK